MNKLCVIVLLSFVGYSLAALSVANRDGLLALHNEIRATVQPTPYPSLKPLIWDLTLANISQNRANLCQKSHSLWHLSTIYGENVFYGKDLNVATIKAELAQQASDYDYFQTSCFGDRCEGHTQVVLSNVTSFGCGWATCADSTIGELVVCHYNKYAYSGVFPYSTNVVDPNAVDETSDDEDESVEDQPDVDWSEEGSTGVDDDGYFDDSDPAADGLAKRDVEEEMAAKTPTGRKAYSSGNIDYRKTKLVQPIVNQGQCGSCWAFSTAVVVEAAWAVKKGKAVPLSQQEILDCTGSKNSCNGGWPGTALDTIIKSGKGGLSKAASYKYKTRQGKCARKAASARIKSFGQTKGTKKAMLDATAIYGPTSVFVFADNKWQLYKKGTLSATKNDINHAINLVGYNAKSNYYIVRNSWGKSWGQSGYAYVSAAKPYGMQKYGAFYALAA